MKSIQRICMVRIRQWWLVVAMGVLATALPLRAEFNLLEDFDGLELGSVEGQQSTGGGLWSVAPEGTDTQVVKPVPDGETGDQALSYIGTSVRGSHVDVGDPAIAPHVWIEDGKVGTMFCRFYQPDVPEARAYHWIGFTDFAGDQLPSVATQYYRGAVQFYNLVGSPTEMDETVSLDVPGGASAGQRGPKVADIEKGVWYNLWFVADNGTDTYDVYLTSGLNSATEADRVIDDLSFIEALYEYPPWPYPLKGVSVRGGSGTTDFYIDHIYWDGVGENLSNPYVGGYAKNPTPADGAVNVPPTTMLSWELGDKPFEPGVANPAIYEQKLYMNKTQTDPNLVLLATLDGTTTSIDPATYGRTLTRDAAYIWRVDTYAWQNDPNMYQGALWEFEMEPTAPILTLQPESVFADPGDDVEFAVAAYNPFTSDATGLTYQWFKVGDPDDVELTDGAEFTGTATPTLTVLDAQPGDDGDYYCAVTLTANSAVTNSDQARLVTRQLLAHWKFDGSYLDATGNGHDADPNGVVQYVTGVVAPTANGAIQVDAMNGWATAGTWDPSGASNQLAITAWVKPDVGGADSVILSKRLDWDNMRWSLRMQDSGEVLFFNNGNSLESAATLEIGAWNHVAAVFDGTGAESVAKVYVNGEPSGELVGFTLNPGADTTVRIGHSDAAINQTWLGALDDIRVYNYAVDVLEIAGQYYSVTGDTPCIYPIDASYDVNQDCVVDLLDLASFGAGWLTTGLYPDCCP